MYLYQGLVDSYVSVEKGKSKIVKIGADHRRQTDLSHKPCLETRHRIIGARQKAIIINRKSQSRETLGGAFIGRIYATSPIFSFRVRCQI